MDDTLKKLFNLEGKVAVITGGGGILCSCISKALSKFGVKIAVLDLMKDMAEQTAEEIRKDGGTAIAIYVNVLEKKSLESAKQIILEKFGKIDILINGAGGNKKDATTSDTMSFFDMSAESIRWVFDLNFIGSLLPTQVFGEYMKSQKEGTILNISSMSAYQPLTKVCAYSAAKAAISNFTQWLAVHMAQNYSDKIRVNAIAPGFFITNQNRYLLIDEKTNDLTPRGQKIINKTPMAKFGVPEDLISTMIWLLSPSANFITGIVVPVDGGFSAYSGV